jgi:hypothetical protein
MAIDKWPAWWGDAVKAKASVKALLNEIEWSQATDDFFGGAMRATSQTATLRLRPFGVRTIPNKLMTWVSLTGCIVTVLFRSIGASAGAPRGAVADKRLQVAFAAAAALSSS